MAVTECYRLFAWKKKKKEKKKEKKEKRERGKKRGGERKGDGEHRMMNTESCLNWNS